MFLLINVGMAGLLLKEERDAKQQDQDTATLYDKVKQDVPWYRFALNRALPYLSCWAGGGGRYSKG